MYSYYYLLYFRYVQHSLTIYTFKENNICSVGLMYLRGLYGLNHHDIELLFTNSIGPNVFGATMSQQRMKFLLALHLMREQIEQNSGQQIGLLLHVIFLKLSIETAQSMSYLPSSLQSTRHSARCDIKLPFGNTIQTNPIGMEC